MCVTVTVIHVYDEFQCVRWLPTCATVSTSVSDAVRIWNLAPESVVDAKSLYQAKNAIKRYVKCLPI